MSGVSDPSLKSRFDDTISSSSSSSSSLPSSLSSSSSESVSDQQNSVLQLISRVLMLFYLPPTSTSSSSSSSGPRHHKRRLDSKQASNPSQISEKHFRAQCNDWVGKAMKGYGARVSDRINPLDLRVTLLGLLGVSYDDVSSHFTHHLTQALFHPPIPAKNHTYTPIPHSISSGGIGDYPLNPCPGPKCLLDKIMSLFKLPLHINMNYHMFIYYENIFIHVLYHQACFKYYETLLNQYLSQHYPSTHHFLITLRKLYLKFQNFQNSSSRSKQKKRNHQGEEMNKSAPGGSLQLQPVKLFCSLYDSFPHMLETETLRYSPNDPNNPNDLYKITHDICD